MTSSNILALPQLIDSTMMVAFRACPKKFYWEFVQCLRPEGRSLDLVAGGAFAAGLEAAYLSYYSSHLTLDESLGVAYAAFAESWGDFPDPASNSRSGKSFNRTYQAILSYFDQYGIKGDHVQPLLRHDGRPCFEFSFAIPLDDKKFPRHPSGEPFIYSGRFDAFGHIDSNLVIRDEKTMGSGPDELWSKKFNLRNQFLGYIWAAQRSGFQTNTMVVRGITIQKTQFQHIEAVKIYPQIVLQRFEDQLARDLFRMLDCWNSGYFDYDLGDACTSFNRPCAFMDLCSDSHPETWFSDFTRAKWNPLTRTNDPIQEAAE